MILAKTVSGRRIKMALCTPPHLKTMLHQTVNHGLNKGLPRHGEYSLDTNRVPKISANAGVESRHGRPVR